MLVQQFQAFLIICMTVLFSSTNGLTDEQLELINALHADCSAETGATEDQIAKARKGNFVDDIKLKCYIKCVFEEVGLVNDDGTIDADGMRAIIPAEYREKSEKIINTIMKCNIPNGQGLCETVWNIHKCYYAKNPQDYFLP